MSGWSQMKLTVSCCPWMTLTTPSGMPASFKSSTNAMHAEGSRSEGFITYVLPQMVPIGNILQFHIDHGALLSQSEIHCKMAVTIGSCEILARVGFLKLCLVKYCALPTYGAQCSYS